MRQRKKIYYMDMAAVEFGKNLSRLEQLAHERLLTTRDWDRLFFWMDIEFALECLTDYECHCFVASQIQGYTETEIATRLKVSHKAISKQIKKARRKIMTFLQEGGYKTP